MAVRPRLKVQQRKTTAKPKTKTTALPLAQKPSDNVPPNFTIAHHHQDKDESSLPLKKRAVLLSYEQVEPLDLSKGYKCNECSRTFKLQDRLKAHLRRHEIKKSGRYTCDECKKQFVQQSSLITHKRIHTGEKPFDCCICQNAYGDLSTFTKHLRIHTGEKPYECEYCHQQFSQSGNCLRHKRSVHADLHLGLATKSWSKCK